ncbi:unnamed protein product [Phaedon cochleariae]|uniref:Uncharacterized protein n=1 Tax=Phaedon cochleariae TaxID=80249 RepID=A0A9P0GRV2_PHACE|nr:unnamed protein product [Phaedon cochleariae]
MKQFLVAAAILALAHSLPAPPALHRQVDPSSGPINRELNDVPILRLDNNNDGESYNYALETGNGIAAQETGSAKGEDGTNAQGEYSYTAPDGQQIQARYVAGPNGFEIQGSHLPVAPPVPQEILKALEQNAADEARGVVDDGQYHGQ